MESMRSKVEALIAQMSPAEKAGQLTQFFYFDLPCGDSNASLATTFTVAK